MQKKSIDSVKRFKQLLLPDIRLINRQWLQQLVPDYWLEKCLHSNHAIKLLNAKFQDDYSIPVPDKTRLESDQRWLLLDIDDQNTLAKIIGASVCAPLIRTVIKKQHVSMLIKQLGDEFYSSTLSSSEILATGVTRTEFQKFLVSKQLEPFLIAVGISALQSTLESESDFFSVRMKFSFPKYCWKIKPDLKDVDRQALSLCLHSSGLLPVEDEKND